MLMVTDSSSTMEYTMINLLAMNLGGKSFEINKSNIVAAGLVISSRILAEGGSEEDLRTIYLESERELKRLKTDIAEPRVDVVLDDAVLLVPFHAGQPVAQAVPALVQRRARRNDLDETEPGFVQGFGHGFRKLAHVVGRPPCHVHRAA